MVEEKANALTPTTPTPSKPKAADSITGFVQTERELLLLLIKENLSFNSSHSWLDHMQPSRKKQAFNKKASTGFIELKKHLSFDRKPFRSS
jgi:hypothetical protein